MNLASDYRGSRGTNLPYSKAFMGYYTQGGRGIKEKCHCLVKEHLYVL